ncbi:MAG TPA: hypothetical protein VJU52_14645 [Flavobacterium sp.]|nr:hypothetical protein [Flavobacterium sp.]
MNGALSANKVPAVRYIPSRLVFRDETRWDTASIRAKEPAYSIFGTKTKPFHYQ